jgi:hypothetical protein
MQKFLFLRVMSDYNVALPRSKHDDDRGPGTRDAHRPVQTQE